MPVDELVQNQAGVEESPDTLEELPILTVRDTVLFPHAMLPITVGRPSSLALVQSLGENRMLGVVSQIDPRTEQPGPGDLYRVGTLAILHKAIQVPKESLLLFCEGVARIRTLDFTSIEPFLKAKVERMPELEPEKTPEIEALRQNVVGLFQQVVAAAPNLSDDVAAMAQNITEPGRLADYIAGTLPGLSHPERQALLEEIDPVARLHEIHRYLTREVELLELRGKIQSEVKGQISRASGNFICASNSRPSRRSLGRATRRSATSLNCGRNWRPRGCPKRSNRRR